MINKHLRARGICDEELLEAFLEIPRERFVPGRYTHQSYDDCPLPIGFGQTISQPYIVALMISELDVAPQHRVLDVGAGSGYQTAILAHLAKHVSAAERISVLTEKAICTLAALDLDNVTLCTLDGSMGWPEEAPFDRIISGAAGPDVPPPWIHQLADGGKIVMPIDTGDGQFVCVLEKSGDKITRRQVCGVRFVKLIGREGFSGP